MPTQRTRLNIAYTALLAIAVFLLAMFAAACGYSTAPYEPVPCHGDPARDSAVTRLNPTTGRLDTLTIVTILRSHICGRERVSLREVFEQRERPNTERLGEPFEGRHLNPFERFPGQHPGGDRRGNLRAERHLVGVLPPLLFHQSANPRHVPLYHGLTVASNTTIDKRVTLAYNTSVTSLGDMMSIAADVRKLKEQNPEKFCYDPKCLWRVLTSRGFKPCPKHPVSFAGPRFNLVAAQRSKDAVDA